MSNVAQGVVDSINSKPAGRGTAYSVKIGSDWYGLGFKAPNFQKGDTIKFMWTANGQYKNMDPASVQVLPKAEAAPKVSHGAQPHKNSGGMSKDEYWERKEERDLLTQKAIQWQAARNVAVEVTRLALEQGLIKLPAKQGAKLDTVLEFIKLRTEEFNDEIDVEVYGKEPKVQRTDVDEGTEDFNDEFPE